MSHEAYKCAIMKTFRFSAQMAGRINESMTALETKVKSFLQFQAEIVKNLRGKFYVTVITS